MKVAIMQPYFYPYLGYYQLMSECDIFIYLDDVNFIRKGFIHRNFVNVGGDKSQINLRLSKASQNKKINELNILDSTSDFKNKIETTYKSSMYWENVAQLLEAHVAIESNLLSNFLVAINENFISWFNFDVRILKSSEIRLEIPHLRGEARIIELVKAVGGDHYLNLPGGKDLYSDKNFCNNNIKLEFIEPQLKVNGELENAFSIIDCVANYGFDYLSRWYEAIGR